MVCVCAPLTLEMYEMNWNWTGAARAETDKQSSYDLMLKQHTFVYFAAINTAECLNCMTFHRIRARE